MLNVLRQACYDGGTLRHVREASLDPGSPRIAAIELQFDALTITIAAVSDDDTVQILPGPIQTASCPGSGPLWPLCVGKSLQWAWLMTNQQGYTDGVRLEFGESDNPESVLVDLVVAASGLDSFQAVPVGA